MATNLFVRDNRRLEVVADGLPLFGGVQLAVDTTLVSAIQGDGQPQRGAAEGWCGTKTRRKETTYPELGWRARLVVLALEVGLVTASRTFVQLLAEARTRSEPLLMRRRTGMASSLVLNSLLCSCTGLCSFPVGAPRRTWGGRSHAPDHEVERDQHHAGLCG